MPDPTRIYRFGPFALHTRSREIYKFGTKLKLRPQPFQVLQLLAERAGDVVSREDLRQQLWPKETYVDFEHGLNTAIKELRGVLSDSASEPRLIETLPRLGYRLMVPVTIEEPTAVPEVVEFPAREATSRAIEEFVGFRGVEEKATPSRRWIYAAAMVAILVAGSGFLLWKSKHSAPAAHSAKIMLAVLPFENLTGDPSQEYFSDGLTEEMIGQLGRLDPQHLGVIGRTSVMGYKQSHRTPEQIGRELGVQYLLEGSVRRDAGHVRISAQLIQLGDRTNVWTKEYDRELHGFLAVQTEISQQIAGEIRVALRNPSATTTAQAATLSPNSYEAYDLYLRGLYFWNKRTPEGFSRAVEYFQRATEHDPQYARAYAGLADSYALMSGYTGLPPYDLIQKAQAAARRGAELDDSSAEVHTALAVVAQNYEWDWAKAEREYRRAIELDANYATAHQWYAEFLSFMGRFPEAEAEIDRARQLDPVSLVVATEKGVILYYARDYDGAIQQLRGVLDMDSQYPRAFRIDDVYMQKGMSKEIKADLGKFPPFGSDAWNEARLTYLSAHCGLQDDSEKALTKLENIEKNTRVDPYILAIAYSGLKKNEKALEYLEKSYRERSIALASLKVEPLLDPLRDDPRFRALLSRMNFPQ